MPSPPPDPPSPLLSSPSPHPSQPTFPFLPPDQNETALFWVGGVRGEFVFSCVCDFFVVVVVFFFVRGTVEGASSRRPRHRLGVRLLHAPRVVRAQQRYHRREFPPQVSCGYGTVHGMVGNGTRDGYHTVRYGTVREWYDMVRELYVTGTGQDGYDTIWYGTSILRYGTSMMWYGAVRLRYGTAVQKCCMVGYATVWYGAGMGTVRYCKVRASR